jgi:micrococcal nuclease
LRRLIILSAVAITGFAAATTTGLDRGTTASAAPVAAPYKASGTVTRVIDGDTVEVRLPSGKTERVRILGIDTPEIRPRQCYATEATAATRQFAQGKRVRLLGDRTQATRDSYKRLLAYVGLPGGADLGQKLVAGGFATVYVYNNRPFTRVQAYRNVQASAKRKRIGLWASCGTVTSPKPPVTTTPKPPLPPPTTTTTATTTTTTTTGTTTTAPAPPAPAACHASYPDFCIPPPPPDKNCSDFSQKNFTVRHDVPTPDPHRLDGNKDGKACES